VKFPFVFKQKKRQQPYFFMTDESKNNLPDLTDPEEIRKAIIANEILTRKY
jgi:hypothetical protein